MTTITRSASLAQRPDRGPEFPAPRYRRVLGADRATLIFWAVIIVLAALVLAPVVPTLYQSVLDRPLYESGKQFTLDNYRGVLATGGSLIPAFRNSLIVSFLTTGIALTLGSAAAYARAARAFLTTRSSARTLARTMRRKLTQRGKEISGRRT